MSDVPKCKSWLGHKFEARYSKGPARVPTDEEAFWPSVFDQVSMAESRRTITYECDVCVRCGHVVQPPVENHPA